MSMMEPEDSLGIQFLAEEANELDEHGRRVISVSLEILDRVPKTTWEMDSLNWCGGQTFQIGSLEQAKEIYQSLGKNIAHWEQMQLTGKVIFK